MSRMRWPLHPSPVVGEALSSWISRVANEYAQTPEQLLADDLGYPGLHDEHIDLMPPRELLCQLRVRAGLSIKTIDLMTLAGHVPTLLDDLNGSAESFNNYCHRYSVLLPPGRRSARLLPGWRPWWSVAERWPVARACRECIEQAGFCFYRLAWRLPILSCCPVHGLMLERAVLGRPDYCHWPETNPMIAAPALQAMDRRTWAALTRGTVELPGRAISAAAWLRLLRTVVDELSARSGLQGDGSAIKEAWNRAGVPYRAGLEKWECYEALPHERQTWLMQGAAEAIQAIETRNICTGGLEACYFRQYPLALKLAVDNGDDSPEWRRIRNIYWGIDHRIAWARIRPEEAPGLRTLLLWGRFDAESVAYVDGTMRRLGFDVRLAKSKRWGV